MIIEEKTGAASASPSTFSHDQLTMIQSTSWAFLPLFICVKTARHKMNAY
ncbi:hypothetical protein HMPREF9087_3134 [Enterococcus casseliflavus ATCC 12755]|uniref:Uncharacterized protein n=1 Tax=Enterococcus casseliflavus ATCC 12755 TaxID=888066 RepID=F0ENZ2_ENTCA|nr:hypothetical protein HMPREF9087_3134 [Enterococcus casseliflavus ATCC 12755]MBV6371465.1 hypothetical protein [Enterococcus casseliflavus]